MYLKPDNHTYWTVRGKEIHGVLPVGTGRVPSPVIYLMGCWIFLGLALISGGRGKRGNITLASLSRLCDPHHSRLKRVKLSPISIRERVKGRASDFPAR
jgi:hypothetical protein